MPNYFFDDIDDVKKYVGGAVNKSVSMASLEPSFLSALENHIEYWLSTAMWNKLVELENGTSEIQEPYKKLIAKVKRPLAMLGMYEYMDVGGIQISESGIIRKEGENFKQAYKYQENAYKRKMLNNGYEAIEKMLLFLEANENDYNEWKTDEAYKRNKSLVINYASEFRAVYSNYVSRYTFEILRPLIEDLEVFVIIPLIGDDQYEELKDNILLKSLSEDEKKLLKLIQKVVANFAVEEGIKRHWIRIEGKKVIQNEQLENQSYEKSLPATMQQMNTAVNHNNEYANRYVSRMMKYLNDNLDTFPSYKAFKEAQEAAAAAEASAEEVESDFSILNDDEREGVIRV